MAAEGVIEKFGRLNQHPKSLLLDARTSTGAGPAIKIEGINKHSILMSCVGGTSASYQLQFSPDGGTTWINYWSSAKTLVAGETEAQSLLHLDADMVRLYVTAITGSALSGW